MSSPSGLRYLDTHEWARLDGREVVVGITRFAVDALQDLVFIDLPDAGAAVTAKKAFGEIESVKAVADLNAPVAGTVSEINVSVEEHLEILSRDPWNQGWLIKLEPRTKSLDGPELMDAQAYEAFITASKH